MVQWILVDIGRSMDIITLTCIKMLQYEEKDLGAIKTPIIGFGGQVVEVFLGE